VGKLYVIRHSLVAVDPKVPPVEWNLSEEGKIRTVELIEGEQWDDLACIYHSPEPKAEQTAAIIARRFGVRTAVCDDLRELHADVGFLPGEQFQERVGAYLDGRQDPCFEDYEQATKRIVHCVEEIVTEAGDRSVAIVSHGRILTALFSAIRGERLGRAGWQSIGLPDLSVVDWKNRRVERGFLSS
jgi:2,3-bisphosphoglycerate-dependent phosphoglycerate mutase